MRLLISALVLACLSQANAAPMAGLTSSGTTIVFFDTATPGVIVQSRNITGLPAGETLVAIDTRPATGALFGLTSLGRVVSIDGFTGAVVSPSLANNAFAGAAVGMDFNPTVDRMRVVTSANENFRLNPDTGGLAGTDTALTPAGSKVGVAYDRNVAGATVTTMFVIDSGTDTLARQGGVDGAPSPNGGVITDIGPLGVNTSTAVGFDISSTGTAMAVLTPTSGPGLYTINLTSGAATLVGAFPVGTLVSDITHIAGFPAPLQAPTISWLGALSLIAGLMVFATVILRKQS
jgi:Domain of unknown function (DUF4394)